VVIIGIFNKIEFWKKYDSNKDDKGFEGEVDVNRNDIELDRTGISRQGFEKQLGMPTIEHKQPTDFGELSGFEGSSFDPESLREDNYSFERPQFQQKKPGFEQFQNAQQSSTQKDIEIILSKLDAIKLILEDMDRRISEIEKIAKE